MKQEPWVVVTLKARPQGPGGGGMPRRTRSAIVFASSALAHAWIKENTENGRLGRYYNPPEIFIGDPAFLGAPEPTWDDVVDPVHSEGI